MQMPTAEELMLAWENALERSPTRRALALLAPAWPQLAPQQLAQWPVGARDAQLFRLRRALFGDSMAALAQCPACGERLDVAFGVGDVCPQALQRGEPECATAAPCRLRADGYEISYRVPTSADLFGLARLGDATAQQAALLRRCVSAIECDGAALALDSVPAAVADAIAEAMAQADPQASIELALSCPACGHGWRNLLDIAAFLWREVDAWARRTVLDVHTLARAYGWSEAHVLALSTRRRQLYLDLVRQ
jgi:uncharacterized protein (UPF0212 family)